jgi:putative addiction module component (TIGR02574 family)
MSSTKEAAPMPTTLQDLGIDRLSVAERLALVDEILDSLPEQVEPADVPPWHLPELARRRAEAVAQPGVGRPWREVLGTLEGGS